MVENVNIFIKSKITMDDKLLCIWINENFILVHDKIDNNDYYLLCTF